MLMMNIKFYLIYTQIQFTWHKILVASGPMRGSVKVPQVGPEKAAPQWYLDKSKESIHYL